MFVDTNPRDGARLKRVLVVERESDDRDVLRRVLTDSGYEVRCASNPSDGLSAFREDAPFLVFTTPCAKNGGGEDLIRSVKQAAPDTLVVVLTESGESAGTLSALRSGAGGVIDKPVRGEQIRELAQRYEALREEPSEPSGYLVAGLVDHLDVRMLLGNDTAMVTPATHLFTRFLEPFFDESDRTSIRLGLYEILINAIEHGSLEIDFETKTKALEQEHYLHVLQERRAEPRFADRSVTVEMKVEKGACRFIVTDEGNGFDWRHWMDGFDELNIPGAHGRGILMTRFYFDEVHYNDHGNEVVLVKLMANGQP